jgi:zinc protease
MPARLRRYALSLLVVLGLTLGHLPVLAGEPIAERLPNGLEVVVQRLDRAPVVSVQIWVKAGSRLEEPAERGLTHQIEHMIFKGTPSRGLGQVAGQIEEAGGRINAYTSFDHTVYHATLPSERWELGLDVLADAVKNSLFEAGELAKEKEVVLEEWRRGQDSPHRLLFETVLGTAFRLSPYRSPVIGSDATIRGFTRQMILDYMARWYTADRVTLVVVGQVEPEAVLAKARQVLGDFRPANHRLYQAPQEPPQAEFRFQARPGRVKKAYLALAFRAFGLTDPRTPAADLLAELLGGGQASRLVERLWGGRGLVSSISASSFTPLDEGLLWVTAACDPAKVEEVVGAIWQELARTTVEPFSPAELARTKLAFKAAFIRDKETMDGQASKLGYFEVLAGGLDREALYLQAVESLDRKSVV